MYVYDKVDYIYISAKQKRIKVCTYSVLYIDKYIFLLNLEMYCVFKKKIVTFHSNNEIFGKYPFCECF